MTTTQKTSSTTSRKKAVKAVTNSAPEENSVIVLPASATIFEAADIQESIRKALQTGPVVIDLSAVEEIDLSVIQLLVAASANASTQNAKAQNASLSGATEAVTKLFEQAGLASSVAC